VSARLNLTKEEFRRAAKGGLEAVAAPVRAQAPGRLLQVDQELRRRGQVVLQGAPGVGKTYVALQYVDWLTVNRRTDSQVSAILRELPSHEHTPESVAQVALSRGLTAIWDIAQFHPSYGYEDFVRTLAPQPVPNGVTFHGEHRRLSFIAAVGEELEHLGSPCDVALIVDEINRADIARVFGELLYALEYRGEQVSTPYEVDGSTSLTIPANLLLIGTMNTADRSIALIDYALRRRFTFIDLMPDRDIVEQAEWLGSIDQAAALRLYDHVASLFEGQGPDVMALAIGHSYFLPSGSPTTEQESLATVARRFAYEVAPLLQEYAAEGLVDRTAVTSVLVDIGVTAEGRQQREIEEQVLAWLTLAPK
jgi:5-methylcytosine-specific restriction enzyme B